MDTFGFDEFETILKQIDEQFSEEIDKELIRIANKLVGDIKLRTPVDTGNLRRSIDKDEPKKKGNEYIIEVGTNVFYAPFQEFGFKTKSGGFVKGKHMFESSIEKLKEELPDELEKWLEKLAGRLKL